MKSVSSLVARQFGRARKLPTLLPGHVAARREKLRSSLAIVMYHGVTDHDLDVPNWSHLHVDEFDRQIHFLSEHYRLLPLDEAIERLREGLPIPDGAACITFDDGFRNVATTAFPVLEKYGAPATVFLITSVVGSRRTSWPDRLYHNMARSTRDHVPFEGRDHSLATASDRERSYASIVERMKSIPLAERQAREEELSDWLGEPDIGEADAVRMMDWDEVDRLASSGLVQFGSHTHTHPILSQCSPDVQRQELETARDILRERGHAWHLLAYPNGRAVDFTEETKRIASELDYHCGIATIEGLNRPDADLFALRRVNVSNRTYGRKFERLMVGL